MEICTTLFNITLGFTLIFTVVAAFLFIMDAICPNPAWALGDLEVIAAHLPPTEGYTKKDMPIIPPTESYTDVIPSRPAPQPGSLLAQFPHLL